MSENEKLRALLAEARREHDGDANIGACGTDNDGGDTRCDRCKRIDAALAEPVVDEPATIRFGSPVYACIDCGYCDDGLTLVWRDGESTNAMCVKCRQNRVENIEGAVLVLVRERDEARAEVRRTYKELSESIAREAAAYEHGAESMREAAAKEVFAFYGWSKDNETTRTDIKNLAELIDDLPIPEDEP